MHEIVLICWSCGKRKGVLSPPIRFGFELILKVQNAGWIGADDCIRQRVLIFCSSACEDAQRTKAGPFRLRPRRVLATAVPTKEGTDGPG